MYARTSLRRSASRPRSADQRRASRAPSSIGFVAHHRHLSGSQLRVATCSPTPTSSTAAPARNSSARWPTRSSNRCRGGPAAAAGEVVPPSSPSGGVAVAPATSPSFDRCAAPARSPDHREGVAIAERFYGSDSMQLGSGLTHLGPRPPLAGKLVEADQVLRRALAIYERTYGKVHPRIAANLNELGLPAGRQGRLDDAEALYRRQAAIYREVYDDKHHLHGLVLTNLGGVQIERNDHRGGSNSSAERSPSIARHCHRHIRPPRSRRCASATRSSCSTASPTLNRISAPATRSWPERRRSHPRSPPPARIWWPPTRPSASPDRAAAFRASKP